MKFSAAHPKLTLIVLLLITFCFFYVWFGDSLTLENLASQEGRLRSLKESNPILIFGFAFLFYVVVTGMALPGASVLSLLYAWFFGFWQALFLISFASTAGATISFLTSRYIFRDWMQKRFGDRLTMINRNLKQEGAFYLLSLRLIPVFPFFVINLVMGLTPMKTSTFWWVSQIGMIPGTVVYVFAGSSVPNLQQLAHEGLASIVTLEILVAFTILGIFPLVIRYLMNRLGKQKMGRA